MFVTTARNPAALDSKARAMRWPGPRVLLIGPESSEMSGRLEAALQYYLVVDLAQQPSSRFDALRLAISRLARARVALTGPLLFSNGSLPDKEIDRLERMTRSDPWLVEFATDPVKGSLSTLVLGERIVNNPLLKTFFANLSESIGENQTPGVVAEIEKHLR
jgi:hypothetical protein